MMMIMKDRARKPLVKAAASEPKVAIGGVGGLMEKPVYVFRVGEFRVFIPQSEWEKLSSSFRLQQETP